MRVPQKTSSNPEIVGLGISITYQLERVGIESDLIEIFVKK